MGNPTILEDYPSQPQRSAVCFSTWRRAQKSAVDREVSVLEKRDLERYTLGVVYEPDVTDSQGEYADAATIRKAAFDFATTLQGRLGDNHTSWDDAMGRIVETYTAPADMVVSGQAIRKGSWLLGVVWSPDYFAKIQKGERVGLSMGGRAERELVNG